LNIIKIIRGFEISKRNMYTIYYLIPTIYYTVIIIIRLTINDSRANILLGLSYLPTVIVYLEIQDIFNIWIANYISQYTMEILFYILNIIIIGTTFVVIQIFSDNLLLASRYLKSKVIRKSN